MAPEDSSTHVYLSPHLDDAVFSCAGRIWQQVQAGDRVIVVTVFAGSPAEGESLSTYALELHGRWRCTADAAARRQREDREALAVLGAEGIHWCYKDCVYRTTSQGDCAYPSEASLWGPVHAAEGSLVRELTGRIDALPPTTGTALYGPLAAGSHVDHRIVRRAAEGSSRRVTYYEDFPYSTDPSAVDAALRGARWDVELIHLSQEALEAKMRAMACYRSQISTFWNDLADLRISVQACAERIGAEGFAERYWRPAACS